MESNLNLIPKITSQIASWPQQRLPWMILSASACLLVLTALYFQHIQHLAPCEQCIYQRTAMIGLAFLSALPLINPQQFILRTIGFLGWLGTSLAGLLSAHYHVWIQTGNNALFASCRFEPNFPSWLPLHHWLPDIFAVTGLCSDTSWQFLGWVMSEWMRVIFIIYLLCGVAILLIRLIKYKKI